jgi:hypothetical protein
MHANTRHEEQEKKKAGVFWRRFDNGTILEEHRREDGVIEGLKKKESRGGFVQATGYPARGETKSAKFSR